MPSLTFKALMLCAFVVSVFGCASAPPVGPSRDQAVPDRLPLVFNAQQKMAWEVVALPGKLQSVFRLEQESGRSVLTTASEASVSVLRRKLHIDPAHLGTIEFEWRVSELIAGADMTERDAEDSPVRLVLAFDGDRSRFSPRNAMLSELTRTLTGEAMPYAVLMYVWSNTLPVGTVITNPRTDRIRKIVVESGAARLQQWLRYERDVRADFELAFGEAPGTLQSLAVMTDTDNTRGRTQAGYGEIRLNAQRSTSP